MAELKKISSWSNALKTPDAYRESLDLCRTVAHEEHKVAQAIIRDVSNLIQDLSKKVQETTIAKMTSGKAMDEASVLMEGLSGKLSEALHNGLSNATKALEQKSHQLDRFTITLFGRTMAGKSTLREALTGGDGGTIGKGSQRTTRDVIEYEWESLRLVDTPGIGAYEGGVDRDLALSILDESDLVLFLLSSDGIQEESFKGMQALRERNKPVIFVLNVKENIENPVLRKRFLRNPGELYSDANLGGHYSRIRTLAGELLGMKEVTVLPIHALAAFLATRPTFQADASRLQEVSGLDRLLSALVDEVQRRGPVRRIQTITDGTINGIQDLQTELRDQSKAVRQVGKRLKGKFYELDIWLDSYIRSTNQRIEQESQKKFKSLMEDVSNFVDDNLEKADFGEKWKKKVDSRRIPEWLGKQQDQIKDELLGRLSEFHREAQLEAKIATEIPDGSPESFDPFDTRRTFGWTSAAGGAASAGAFAVVALEIGSTNFWNPVGWVCLGISVVFGIFAWFSDSREKKMQKEKLKVSDNLRKKVEELQGKVTGNLKAWFCTAVTDTIAKDLRKNTRGLIRDLFELSGVLEDGSKQVGVTLQDMNRRLLVRTCQFQGFHLQAGVIGSIARDPGNRIKFLWRGTVEPTFRSRVGKVLGEWVDGIPEGPMEGMVAAALRPARITPDQVSLREGRAQVTVSVNEKGKAFGRGRINLILASRLLNIPIYLN